VQCPLIVPGRCDGDDYALPPSADIWTRGSATFSYSAARAARQEAAAVTLDCSAGEGDSA